MDDLNDRQREILDLVRRSGLQTIHDLSERFGVATQTIRRDINDLSAQGAVRRVHGGVMAPPAPINSSFNERRVRNEPIKARIGHAAAAMIPNGSTVMLGVGTTVQYVARALMAHNDLTVITNNLEVAVILCDAPAMEVHLVGGTLRSADRDVTGARTLIDYARFSADFGVIGAGGVHPDQGVLDFHAIDADLSTVIMQRSHKTILTVDSSKWHQAPNHRVCGLDEISCMVTDVVPTGTSLPGRVVHVSPDD